MMKKIWTMAMLGILVMAVGMGWYLSYESGNSPKNITVDNISLIAGTTPYGGFTATVFQSYIELTGETIYETNGTVIRSWGERR